MQLYLFPQLMENSVVNALLEIKEGNENAYYQIFPELMAFATEKGVTENTISEYVLHQLLEEPNVGRYLENSQNRIYLKEDIEVIYNQLLEFEWDTYLSKADLLAPPKGNALGEENPYTTAIKQMVKGKSAAELADQVWDFYQTYADGKEALYRAFKWEKGVETDQVTAWGLTKPDTMSFDMLSGIATQKKAIIENTQAFVEGKPANDVLLVGSRGTGKSSCVKAVFNKFKEQELKLLELPKEYLGDLPKIMNYIGKRKCKYILFIDDLSFEEQDKSYSALKVALDGQMESRPDNMLIYATSNRRHLVAEYWKDRNNAEEIYENDILNERLSLSERFGIRLYFTIVDQKEYFAIIEMLLAEEEIPFTEEIGKQAATWAIQNNGRSGRTAKQFVANYIASCQ